MLTCHDHNLHVRLARSYWPVFRTSSSLSSSGCFSWPSVLESVFPSLLPSFVGALGSLPLPDSSSASQHLLLFISALIPKALASLLTSFVVALGGNEQVDERVSRGSLLCNVQMELKWTDPCSGGGPAPGDGWPRLPARHAAGGSETLAAFHWRTQDSWSGRIGLNLTDLRVLMITSPKPLKHRWVRPHFN